MRVSVQVYTSVQKAVDYYQKKPVITLRGIPEVPLCCDHPMRAVSGGFVCDVCNSIEALRKRWRRRECRKSL